MIDDKFEFESKEQREGFGALQIYLRNHQKEMDSCLSADQKLETALLLVALFFIQKDHESNEYWRDLVADQLSRQQDEILRLNSRSAEMERQLLMLIRK